LPLLGLDKPFRLFVFLVELLVFPLPLSLVLSDKSEASSFSSKSCASFLVFFRISFASSDNVGSSGSIS
jgi:hypothetical protein